MDRFPANQSSVQLDERIALLKRKHQALEVKLGALSSENSPNQLLVKRIKQEKLVVRDQIARLESNQHPDSTA